MKKTEKPSNIKRDPVALRNLIDNCIDGHQYAWDVFFEIFTGDIKKYIRTSLISKDEYKLAADSKTIGHLYLVVAEKLYLDNGLSHIREAEKRGHIGVILAWLKKTSYRKVLDHLDKRRTQKNLSNLQAERNTIELDKPLNRENANTTGHDVIGREIEEYDDSKRTSIGQLFTAAKDDLTAEEWWILRLKFVFIDPLVPKDIMELAAFTGQAPAVIERKINVLMEIMVARQSQEEKKFEKVARLLSVLHHYQYIYLKNTAETPEDKQNKQDIEKKIVDTVRKIKEQQATIGRPLVATNRDIAEVLDPEKNMQVAVKWLRLKKKLRNNKLFIASCFQHEIGSLKNTPLPVVRQ